ncbi:MAG: flagellar hook-length control protein FliK [Steroidobacteraceae bacterium]
MAAVAGKVVKPAAHPVAKAHTPDPVTAAMAMMGQTVSIGAHPEAGGKISPSAASQADGANSINAAGLTAASPPHKLVQTKALTQTLGAEAHTAPAPTAQSGSTAQMVSAGQLAAGVHSAVRPAVAAPSTPLSAPVGSSSWNEQLGTQLTWMVSKGVQNASLQMSPQHLGPVQVSISVHHGQASVWFGAAQPQTREALSQALPQLRAMFASQGLALTDSGVSQDAPRDSRRAARSVASTAREVGAVDDSAGTASVGLAGAGLIDTYA